MTRKLLMGLVAVAAVASMPAACKKDETTITTTTTTTTTTTNSGGGGTGGVATGGGGTGGDIGCPCETCGSYVAACAGGTCPPVEDICGYNAGGGGSGPSSDALLTMQTCVCMACGPAAIGGSDECNATCGVPGGVDAATCLTCQVAQLGGGCATEYGACVQDPCAP